MAGAQTQGVVGMPVRQSTTQRDSKRLSRWILFFAVLTPVFVIGPALMGQTFPPYPLMHVADAFDLFTPLVLIPVYWLLFQWAGKRSPSLVESLVFMLLAAIWVEGQSMHLAANSIGHLVGEVSASDAAKLTYFYDEQLGHYLWHIGLLCLAVLLMYREWRRPAGLITSWGIILPAGFIYGFTIFAATLEGQTAPMSLPFVLLASLVTLIWGRKKLRKQPVLAFFFASFLVATLFYTGWGLYWGGLPEFSQVGIIK
jgi:uncharacterized membrane protein